MVRERSDGWLGRTWRIAEPHDSPPIEGLDAPSFVGRLLRQRGVDTVPAAQEFLNPEWYQPADPTVLGDWSAAIDRVELAARRSEPVAIYGDYDVDGITGTAILTEALRNTGIDARPFIPHREREGYGLQDEAVGRLAADGARVLITADCGITALTEIAAAREEHGLDVIVLDHHEPAESLPEATAIVTPKRAPSGHPLSELSTGGLAYRFAQALAQRVASEDDRTRWLDLAAMSTVADVVPLRGENRWIVHQGLRALESTERPGLRALLKGRRGNGPIDTETIGFQLAPKINAAGRLDDASLALEMLMERQPETARELAGRLEQLNDQRRRLTDEAMLTAERQIRQQLDASGQAPLVLFAGGEGIHHGIVGIVAGRLADQWSRPAFVWSLVDGEARGSGRSAAGFDLVRMLDTSRDLLIRGGGHAMAAGFSAEPSQLGALMSRFNEVAQSQLDAGEAGAWAALEGRMEIDAQVPLSALTRQTVGWIERLAPFGEGNPAPTFVSNGVGVRQAKTVGADGAHLRLDLDGWSAIGWRLGGAAAAVGSQVDIVWRLRRGLQGRPELEIVDLAV
ncbi:MAG: single-stranded-DNA-specific exonuclease RecJ [Chloroflexi bacterium]|nr:single-stranded-DNA-specific exonuclease RecJ [Chloroflexota bacterium]